MIKSSEDIQIVLGKQVKALREKNGFTQEELGLMIGSNGTSISRLEHGRANPRASTLSKLALALGVEITELFKNPPANETIYNAIDL